MNSVQSKKESQNQSVIDSMESRSRIVSSVVASAVQNLLALGKSIPDNEIKALIFKDDVLQWIIRMEKRGLTILALLLCFSFKSLISAFIEKGSNDCYYY